MPGCPMVEEMTLRIGIDFDNTIVDYRPVFLSQRVRWI